MTARPPVRVRRQVRGRAGGQCEYCLIYEENSYVRHQVDHILSLKHGGTARLSNLALSCVLCNRYKGSDVAALDPATGEIVPLFHPRQHRWRDHFTLQGAVIIPLSPIGRATVTLLRLNAPERILEREELIRAARYGLV